MKRRKKNKQEEHVDEAWLLPYSDMLTLLLALFIVMFAMAKVDDEKFDAVSKQFNVIMSAHPMEGGDGILPGHANYTGVQPKTNTDKSTSNSDPKPAPTLISDEEKMVSAGEQIEKQLAEAGHGSDIDINLEKDGLRIAIKSGLLFAPGSADLTPSSQKIVSNIADTLSTISNELIIAGYTDNVPNNTPSYESNWELSAARAITVMEALVKTKGLKEENVSIQAYGEFKPKVPNNNAENRAENRRVEIFIIRKE